MDEQANGFKPPYMSFQTFWTFIGDLSGKPLPPQIDRSLMDSKSGSDQANLTSAMKAFGLIDEELAVLPPLIALHEAGDDDERAAQLETLVRAHYPEPLRVSEDNGTEKLLNDAFRNAYGLDSADTRRKAITFFLHAARTASIPLSPHFPATRAGPGAGGTARPRRARRRTTEGERSTTTPVSGGGEQKVIDFGDAGTVTIHVAVKWLELPTETMIELRQLVDRFDTLSTAASEQELS
jgi:hypothetical protein